MGVLQQYVYPFFMLLGGLAVFMFGMKVMSDSLENLGGSKMRSLLGKVSNNRFAGVGIGAGVTAIIQSSSATTVMLVGFVNVGMVTLSQATSIIMGANIGTTITAQIASLSAYKDAFNITAILALSACIGVFMFSFSKNGRIKLIGEIIAGLGMLFIGMYLMSASMSDLQKSESVLNLFKSISNPFFALLIGIAFTALIQSSSAATGIILSLAGALSPATAIFIILGTNIGTCVTALLSSLGTSVNARRTAIIHLLFNVIGCLIFFIPLAIVYFTNSGTEILNNFMQTIALGSMTYERQIACFHTLFNLSVTLALLPFVKTIVFLANKIVPEKKKQVKSQEELSETHLEFLDERILKTPPLAIAQIKNEVVAMCNFTKESLQLSISDIISDSTDNVEKVKKRELRIDFLNKEITKYLVKISSLPITQKDEKFLGSLYHVVSDVERIGDYADNFAGYALKLKKLNMTFSDDAKSEINDMYQKVNKLFDDSIYAFEHHDENMLKEIARREEQIDELKRVMSNAHIERLNKGLCSAELGSIYYSLASSLERVADHLTNIGFSIKSLTGSQNDPTSTKIMI